MQMVVDEAHGLHEGVANGWPHKLESTLPQIAGKLSGKWRLCWNLAGMLPCILYRNALDELP